MSLTNDHLVALDGYATSLQQQVDEFLAFSAPDVDPEALKEALEWLRLAKQLLQEAQDALDEDPVDDAKVARLKKMAKELLKKAADKIGEGIK
jgi:hypothetical protein